MRAIGIDGGGGHTSFVLYDEIEGILNSMKIDSPSNYHLVGLDEVKRIFESGIKRVSSGSDFDTIGAELSGVDRASDKKFISEIFEKIGVKSFAVSNDDVAALWRATNGIDVLMIAGTGSLVIGRNARGEVRRALGWDMKTLMCSCGDLMSDRSYGHTGFTGTSIWIDPIYNVVVVLLTNRVHVSRRGNQDKLIRFRPLIHNYIMAHKENIFGS